MRKFSLSPFKDYKEPPKKSETCHYELGMKALEADNLKSAAAHFKEVNAEQNKKMQAAFCDKGIAFYEKGDEEKALTYFEYVTDKDLLPKIDAAYYAQALKLVEDGEYDKATEIFAKLGEYEDCPTQLLRIHALKAEPVLQQRRLRKRHRGVQGPPAITATPPPASRRRLTVSAHSSSQTARCAKPTIRSIPSAATTPPICSSSPIRSSISRSTT